MSRAVWVATGLVGCTWIPAKETVVVREVRDDETETATETADTVPDETDPTEPDSTTDPDPVELELSAIVPHYGTDAGGTEVLVTGRFDAATEITFDDVAGTIVSASGDELVVETPPGLAGWVDVRVRSGSRSAAIPEAFQYWTDGEGLAGAVGLVQYVEYVGDYWDGNAADYGYGSLGLVEPDDWEMWHFYAPNLDACSFGPDLVSLGLPALSDSGAQSLTLSAGSLDATLRSFSGMAGWYADYLSPDTSLVPGTIYDLDPIVGDVDWPSFGVTGFVEVPPAFEVTAPDIDRPDPPRMGRSTTFEWTGGGGDYVLLSIERLVEDGAGWASDGVLACAAVDDGSFTIPGNAWPDWPLNRAFEMSVMRVVTTRAILPHNGSEVRIGGVYVVRGAALAD